MKFFNLMLVLCALAACSEKKADEVIDKTKVEAEKAVTETKTEAEKAVSETKEAVEHEAEKVVNKVEDQNNEPKPAEAPANTEATQPTQAPAEANQAPAAK